MDVSCLFLACIHILHVSVSRGYFSLNYITIAVVKVYINEHNN